MSLFGRNKRGKIGYPRLIATVHGVGDVIIPSDDPAQTQKEIWKMHTNGTHPNSTYVATSVYYYGPKDITVRTSAIVATYIDNG